MHLSKKQIGLLLLLLIVLSSLYLFSLSKTMYATSMLGDGANEESYSMTSGGLFAAHQVSTDAPMMEMDAQVDAEMREESFMPPSPSPGEGSVATEVDPADRLIIKNGFLSLLVENVDEAVNHVQQFAVAQKGFVVSSDLDRSGRTPYATVMIRIPSDVFDSGITDLKGIGEVRYESVTGQDVTEEFVDLGAQLENYKATEAQFLEIMKRATDISDVLAVQRELTNVRYQIERIEGRRTYLTESAAFSLLTISLSADPEDLPILDESDAWKPLAVVKDAIRDLRHVAISIANVVIRLTIYIPVWIVLGLLVWGVNRGVQRYSK